MASRLRPEIVARLEVPTPTLVPGAAGAPATVHTPSEPDGEQLEALDQLVDILAADKDLAAKLLGGDRAVSIAVRYTEPGEAWVRVQ